MDFFVCSCLLIYLFLYKFEFIFLEAYFILIFYLVLHIMLFQYFSMMSQGLSNRVHSLVTLYIHQWCFIRIFMYCYRPTLLTLLCQRFFVLWCEQIVICSLHQVNWHYCNSCVWHTGNTESCNVMLYRCYRCIVLYLHPSLQCSVL